MPSQGPNYAGAGSGGTWTSPNNITADDGSVAERTLSSGGTGYLTASSFGFSIPTGATIDGVYAEVERRNTGAAANDSEVYLVIGGSATGDNKSAGGLWNSGFEVATYGGSADLWGTTPTVAQVNASDFGLTIQAVASSFGQCQVDFIRLTVYYTEAGGGARLVESKLIRPLLVGGGLVR